MPQYEIVRLLSPEGLLHTYTTTADAQKKNTTDDDPKANPNPAPQKNICLGPSARSLFCVGDQVGIYLY